MLSTAPGAAEPSSPSTNPFEQGHLAGSQQPQNLLTVEEGNFKLLSQSAIMRMLNIHAEAIARCVELSESQDLPTSTQFLYGLLLDFIGTRYLDIALDE